MNPPSRRIRDLATAGKITDSEAERLLRAVSEPPPPRGLSLFSDPFSRAGGGYAAACGFVIAALGIVATRFGVRYDGFLDLHITRIAVPLRLAVVEQLADVVVPALLFWGFSLAYGSA